MSSDGNVPAAPELVYVPRPSWVPAFTAFGIALVLVGLFAGWFYSAVGAVFLIAAVIRWAKDAGDEVSRMPLEQRTVTAVLPARTSSPE